ncbi:hypothetical protein [Pseudonocardia sp. GCM10023141]|uniref:hypothetical protein n=1 Tax=Pseudonocardia sp. GCM10023141 TaxID=3252653 RepID=UPI00361925B8
MPPRPRAPRTRVSGIRRPRVAGLAPATSRADGSENGHDHPHLRGSVALDEATRPAAAPSETSTEIPADVSDASVTLTKPAGRRAGRRASAATVEVPAVESATVEVAAVAATEPAVAPSPRAGLRGRLRALAVPLLAVLLVLLTGLAVFFGIANANLRGTPAAANTALVDMAATTAATEQLTDALKTVYSYDYARLDENEKAAKAVITPAFEQQYDQLFTQVRQLAPQQQAVVTATIAFSAVQSIEGDHAVLVAFMDQQATRAASGGQPSQLAAAGRLTVSGEKIDGHWKIAGVVSR